MVKKKKQKPTRQWKHGIPPDPDFFPIAVWLQDPARAGEYKAIGVNLYVGLWNGPTEQQLASLKKAGMRVICDQNEVGLAHRHDPLIVGWMHGDEPDNAQDLRSGWTDLQKTDVKITVNGESYGPYGPPVPPYKIIADYRRIQVADPCRPVYLNLGQAVAWENYGGRGIRSRHPEDYALYAKGCDIVSYDIYPVNSSEAEVAGNLWLVAHGVSRLREWTDYKKPVWCWIECTKMGEKGACPTPEQIKSEIWMALIHGASGFGYFCHIFTPKVIGAGCLLDPEMTAGMKKINQQVLSLAPMLNRPTIESGAMVSSGNQEVPVKCMVKKYKGATYLFAVSMRAGRTEATFTVKGIKGEKSVTVLDENRTIRVTNGVFKDGFKDYAVHLYKI